MSPLCQKHNISMWDGCCWKCFEEALAQCQEAEPREERTGVSTNRIGQDLEKLRRRKLDRNRSPHQLDLARRCEEASGPDRELNEAIYEALGAVRPGTCDLYWLAPDGRERHYSSLVPDYSASLDAAVSLVPEGALWEVDHKINTGPRGNELFTRPKGEPRTNYNAGVGVGNKVPLHWEYSRSMTSAALALCAAALRARPQ